PSFLTAANARSCSNSCTEHSEDHARIPRGRSNLYASPFAPQTNSRGTRKRYPFAEELSQKLSALSEDEDFQAFTLDQSLTLTLLTSVVSLLSRVERSKEVSVGIAHHGRVKREEHEVAGPLVIVITLQIDVDAEDSFRSLYGKVRDAYHEQTRNVVFNSESFKPKGRHDVMFSFFRQNELNFSSFPTEPEWRYTGHHEPHHRWRLHFLVDHANQLTLLADTLNESFSEQARDISTRNLFDTLEALANNPDQKVTRYELAKHTDQQASALFGAEPPNTENLNLWTQFEETATTNPQSIVAESDAGSMSYHDLLQESRNIGSAIRDFDENGQLPLPVIANRSSEALKAYLGSLFAGRAFLPIDPALPKERIDSIIKDSDSSLVIDPSFVSASSSREGANRSPIYSMHAYVLHTSGTTGKSNGVQVGHTSVLNLLHDIETRVPLASDTNCMWWTAVSFDVSIYEVFSAILYGRKLCIVPEELRLNSRKLFAWMTEQRIHSAYLPPFMLEDFNLWLAANTHPPLKRLLVGVEPIQESLLASIAQRIEGLKIVNGYGPTETTICATFYDINPSKSPNRRTPIGSPLQGNRCYVLDRNLRMMPIGTTGELFIAGTGVSLGYWNRRELQTSRFLPDPFVENDSSFMYKTGDIVRINGEGHLEFHGREDSQIKLRGQRIELGEIEQTFSQLDQINQCAVAV
ncbi:MAG: amino acid adenylation domain-containing protein, partial [Verrucomicrobiota bacterium]